MLALRVRGVIDAWAVLVMLIVVAVLFPHEEFEVIGRPGVINVLWPLVLSASGVSTVLMQRRWMDPAEAMTPGASRRRLADFGSVLAAVLILSVPTAAVGVQGIVLRDAMLYTSLALALSPFLRSASWFPGVGVGLVCWIQGVNEACELAWWAVPLAPANHLGSWLVALGLVATGAIVAAGRRGRPYAYIGN